MKKQVFKGEIYLVDLTGHIGSEQSGIRPALIIQNDVGNKYSPTTIVVTLTTKGKKKLPTHLYLKPYNCGIKEDSIALFEQIFTIDKKRLIRKVGQVTNDMLDEINNMTKISFGLI